MPPLVIPPRWEGNDCREKVLILLSDEEEHTIAEICAPEVGSYEGMRRLRELIDMGWNIEKRRLPGSTHYVYRLIR